MHFEYISPSEGGLPSQLRSDQLTAALKKTTQLYEVHSEGDVVGWVGLMQESSLSDVAYIWLHLSLFDYSVAELREAKFAIRNFINQFDTNVFAEADASSHMTNKFLAFSGFTLLGGDDERNLYQWGQN